MKRFFYLGLLSLAVLCFSASVVYGQPWDGNGVDGDPYQIWTAEDMQAIGADANYWGAHFKLMKDIDLGSYTGTSFNIIGNPYTPHFTGVFDGNEYTISNFTYTSPDANFIGLFACVGNNGKVKQLVMQNVNASGNWFTAGLVGMNFGKIYDCTITGTISGNNSTGGLAGENYGEISDCSVTAQVQGIDETGGLAGDNHGTILDCYANSNVDGNSVTGGLVGKNIGLSSDGLISWSYATGEVSGDNYNTGGLVGINSYGTVSYCYATGNIDANNGVGGLVGWNVYSTISNCYSTASVLGDEHIGGLVGDNGRSTISNCYSAGVVDGNDDTGGLIGDDHDGTITGCFWDVESSGQSSSDGPEVGKSTADMKKESTFTDADWDFTTPIWKMCDGPDYPKLWWEVCPLAVEVRLTPQMLNCQSEGNWVKAHVILPEGYWPEDIDVNTPAVAEPMGVESEYIKVLDNGKGKFGVEIGFEREAFCAAGLESEDGYLEVKVTGWLLTGQQFEGTDTIKVISQRWRHRERITTIRRGVREIR